MAKDPDPHLVEEMFIKLRHVNTSGSPHALASWMARVEERQEALREAVNVVGRDVKGREEALAKAVDDLQREIQRGWAAANETIVNFRCENQKLAERVAVLEADQKLPQPLSVWQRFLVAFGTLGTGFMLASMLLLLILTLRR